jgi:hypothetical protein
MVKEKKRIPKNGARAYFFVLCAACSLSRVFAGDLFHAAEPPAVYSAEESGYGGLHTAYTRGVFSLFSNMAALAASQESSLIGVSVGFDLSPNGILGFSRMLTDKSAGADELSGKDGETFARAPSAFRAAGPLMLAHVGKSFGFGLFNRVWTSESIKYEPRDLTRDTMRYRAYLNNDFIISTGYAFGVLDVDGHRLDLGLGAKLFYRFSKSLFEQAAAVSFHADRDSLLLDQVPGRQFAGIGVETGLLYRLGERFSFGITMNEAPAAAYCFEPGDAGLQYFLFIPRISAGFAVKLFYNSAVVWALMADFTDILGVALSWGAPQRSPALNIAAGSELVIHNRYFLRFGLRDLLPAAGAGLILNDCRLNLAVSGTEYGASAGAYSKYAVDFSVQWVR